MGIDAFIISDMGVLRELKRLNTRQGSLYPPRQTPQIFRQL
jgi:hypothetical protein